MVVAGQVQLKLLLSRVREEVNVMILSILPVSLSPLSGYLSTISGGYLAACSIV